MDHRHQQHLTELVRRADDAVARHGLQGVRAEVVLVLDVSKSMYGMYKSHAVHELATRLLALSLEFDDDGVIPAYAFGDQCRHVGDLTTQDFASWVEREVIRTGGDFQNGCKYAPAIDAVCSYFFPEDWHRPARVARVGRIFKRTQTVYPTLSAPRALPVFALFVTGGDCQDQPETTDLVRRSSRLPIFWQFVGLQSGKGAPTQFKYLKKLDNLGNTHIDNCGFFEVSDTRNDKVLFDGMTREFPGYLKKREVMTMLASVEDGGLRTKGAREVESAVQAASVERADTAEKLDARDGGGEVSSDALERASLRRAAEQRVISRRTERSQVAMPARTDAEPTRTMAPLTTRTVPAVLDGERTVIRMAAEDDDEDGGVQEDETQLGLEAAALFRAQTERTSMVTARADDDDDAPPARGGRPARPPGRPRT